MPNPTTFTVQATNSTGQRVTLTIHELRVEVQTRDDPHGVHVAREVRLPTGELLEPIDGRRYRDAAGETYSIP